MNDMVFAYIVGGVLIAHTFLIGACMSTITKVKELTLSITKNTMKGFMAIKEVFDSMGVDYGDDKRK